MEGWRRGAQNQRGLKLVFKSAEGSAPAAAFGQRTVAEAVGHVVVDHARSLHEGVALFSPKSMSCLTLCTGSTLAYSKCHNPHNILFYMNILSCA